MVEDYFDKRKGTYVFINYYAKLCACKTGKLYAKLHMLIL